MCSPIHNPGTCENDHNDKPDSNPLNLNLHTMRHILFLALTTLALLVTSCTSTKQMAADKLQGSTWELDYLSGPRIAFDALFPQKIPQLTFDESTGMATGNNGCNGYSAEYTLDGDKISFGEPGPTTMMYCGEGEQHFLKAMEKVNRFGFDADGRLNLMLDDVPMLRFHRVTQ